MRKKYANFLLSMAGAAIIAGSGGYNHVAAAVFESSDTEELNGFSSNIVSGADFTSDMEYAPGADEIGDSSLDFSHSQTAEDNNSNQNQELEQDNTKKQESELNEPSFNMDMVATDISYWKQEGDIWYCVGTDGQLLTGWVKIKNSIYYFNESGQMQTGWLEVNDRWYFMDDTGRLQIGWKEIDGKWFFLNNEYGKLMGHVSLNGYMYYFDPENGMQTGWQEIDGQWFYFRESGRQQDGWYIDGEKWYYLEPESGRSIGRHKIGDYYYFFDEEGVMQTGWQESEGQWFYFRESGRQHDGWYIDGEKWYYLEPETGRCVGQHEIEGEDYFFDKEGVMQTGWQIADGKLFYYQEKGQMLTDAYMRYDDGKLYYLSALGAEEDSSIIGNYRAVYDVTSKVFGANGSDSEVDTKAIQKALDQALKTKSTDGSQILVRIPAGTYYIDDILNISSNTALELDANARIVRTDLSKVMLMGAHTDSENQYCWGESCTHGGYSQLKNITVSGGVWDGNVGSRTDVATSSILTFAHGTDISVHDTTIRNGSGYHLLVLDGIKDSRIENVTFRDQLPYTGRSEFGYFNGENEEVFDQIDEFTEEEWQQLWLFKEALHFDFTNAEGSVSVPFDDTACKNIVVTGCDFEDVLAGVGSHHTTGDKKHIGISIIGNRFANLKGNGVGAFAMENLLVKVNSVDGAYIGLYATENCSNVTFLSNSIKNTIANAITFEYSNGTIKDNSLSVASNRNLGIRVKENTGETILSGNTIKGGFNGISAGNTTSLKVRGNTISGCKNSGISISDSKKVTVETNTVTDSVSGIDIGFWNCRSGICTGNIITNCMADNIKSDEENVTIKDNSAMNPLNGWISINEYWYYYKNGIMQIGWQKVNGKWYYMRPSGRMHTGWLQEGNDWFYLSVSGKMQYGWCKIDNNWYYFNPVGGRMLTGWQKINGGFYYLNASGKMQTGWHREENNWYYLTVSGKAQTGWYRMNEYWYYFSPSGVMQTGWQDINKNRYYFRESGRMQTGWFQDGSKWYYLIASGKMQMGWCNLDGFRYYFSSNGEMQLGWQEIDGSRYYFRESGRMHTEWLQFGNDWYYFSASGKMQTGWQTVGDFRYYFKNDGKMVTGNQIIDGVKYNFGKNGKLIGNA